MASPMKSPLAFVVLLLLSGGLVVVALGEAGSGGAGAECTCPLVNGTYLVCANYPGKKLKGCSCECAPPDGKDCVVYRYNYPGEKCPNPQS